MGAFHVLLVLLAVTLSQGFYHDFNQAKKCYQPPDPLVKYMVEGIPVNDDHDHHGFGYYNNKPTCPKQKFVLTSFKTNITDYYGKKRLEMCTVNPYKSKTTYVMCTPNECNKHYSYYSHDVSRCAPVVSSVYIEALCVPVIPTTTTMTTTMSTSTMTTTMSTSTMTTTMSTSTMTTTMSTSTMTTTMSTSTMTTTMSTSTMSTSTMSTMSTSSMSTSTMSSTTTMMAGGRKKRAFFGNGIHGNPFFMGDHGHFGFGYGHVPHKPRTTQSTTTPVPTSPRPRYRMVNLPLPMFCSCNLSC